MKYEQNSAFLSMCSSINFERDKESATAKLSLNNWPFSNLHQPEILVLEGLNQFAVRIATAFYPDNGKKRYLPTMIEKFQIERREFAPKLIISGRCEMVHDSCRVICTVTTDYDDIIATAAIMVSKTLFDILTPAFENNKLDIPVWEMERNANIQPITAPVSFWFNSAHPIFTEHFPGYAVAPGSLLIEIVLRRLMQFYPTMRTVTISRVKFVQSVRPDMQYRLNLHFSQNDFTVSFSLCFQNSEKRAVMGKIAFKLMKGE